jgi:hypothetical protein
VVTCGEKHSGWDGARWKSFSVLCMSVWEKIVVGW